MSTPDQEGARLHKRIPRALLNEICPLGEQLGPTRLLVRWSGQSLVAIQLYGRGEPCAYLLAEITEVQREQLRAGTLTLRAALDESPGLWFTPNFTAALLHLVPADEMPSGYHLGL